MSFIKKVFDDIIINIDNGNFGDDCKLSDIAFVFPTRRAGLYLKKHILEKEQNKPIWSPDLFSISDFIQEVSKKNFPDRLALIFELYKTYKIILNKNAKNFDKFYPWGKIILSDFNDIDQNLIDQKIFSELGEFSNTDNITNNILKTYNDFMKDLSKLYNDFKENLDKSNSTYYGLAIRELVFTLKSQKNNPFSKWKKIVFAGFNFLTKGEEELLSILKEQEKGVFYWDIDEYFYSDNNQEAGTFFRSSNIINNSSKWIGDELKTSKKSINIIGTPGKIGQTKVMGNLLENLSKKNTNISDNTVIILSDENLLFPVLNSIPPTIKDINISMGSPIKNSPPYSFIFLILNSLIEQQEDVLDVYKFEHIKKLLLHPYILNNYENNVQNFISEHSAISKYINTEDIKKLGKELYSILIFDKIKIDIFQYIENIIMFLKKILIIDNRIELEFLFAFYKQLKRLKDLFLSYKPEISLKQTLKILKDVLENTIIPFSGEPLKGLQILGMLETRAIDFENVYILSVNEGIIPKGKTAQSLIPNDIRKQNGMSYFDKRDAIFAYYFYRIIKSAKNITMIYNTESDNFSKGEKSRFIEQLNHEFKKINKESEISERIITIESEFSIPEQINIIKTEQIIKNLKDLSYSASSINKYLNCSLSFYFRYILRLKEQEQLNTLDAKGFGTFIHEILEYIYKPFLNKELKKDNIEQLIKDLNNIIEKHFKNNLKITDTINGKNYINKIIINKLLSQYFSNEINEFPINIIGLEKRLNRKLEIHSKKDITLINIYGTIDRIDLNNKVLRVIDYKTGKSNSLKNIINLDSSDEEIIEQIKSGKEILQLMVYNYLINGDIDLKKHKNTKYGMIFFKTLSKGTIYLDNTEKLNKISELVISTIISEILDKNTSFVQTENKDNCKHCAYKNICYR